MSDLLKDKVVIVTGASSGIGRAIAISAAQHKAQSQGSDCIRCNGAAARRRRTDYC